MPYKPTRAGDRRPLYLDLAGVDAKMRYGYADQLGPAPCPLCGRQLVAHYGGAAGVLYACGCRQDRLAQRAA